jgi:hypothetical protein
MKKKKKHTGVAIALAWPQTYCKQPGSWYDPLTLLMGINKNHYYRAGHAALVLIECQNPTAHYFDFGRYHAPYKHGRVRSVETDHDLEIKTIPLLSDNGKQIENYYEILHELQINPACHGEGELHASYCPVDFNKALAKARQMQKAGPILYGPFHIKGSNCSRFVNTIILAGNPHFRHWFGLKYRLPLTPTPISNVKALDNRVLLPKLLKAKSFSPMKKLDKKLLRSTLPAPEKHPGIPENAQWLSGEGAGSWFVFAIEGEQLKVTRYSPQGVIECSGLYENQDVFHVLQKAKRFSVVHPSHCKMVSLKVEDSEICFYRAFRVEYT